MTMVQDPTPKEPNVASEETRNSFKVVLDLRRATLTRQELEFLTGLLHGGSEEQVSLASKRLSDPNLFSADSRSQDEEDKPQLDKASSGGLELASSFGSDSRATGSARRRESLHLRKQQNPYGQMWKAHQNGLAVSRLSSRRSILQKEQSIGRLSISMKAGRQSQKGNKLVDSLTSFQSSITTLDWSDGDLDDSSDEEEDGPQDADLDPRSAALRASIAQYRNLRNSSRTMRSSITSLRSSITTVRRGSNMTLSSTRRGSNMSLASTRRGSNLSLASTRRGSNFSLATIESSGDASVPTAASLRRLGSDRRLGLQKEGSQRRVTVAAVPNETEKKTTEASAPRRHTSYQTDRSDLMENIPEGDDEYCDSPIASERPTPPAFEDGLELPIIQDGDGEEKKISDEEMAEKQKQAQVHEDSWHQNLSIRRASAHSYDGEGIEVDFLQDISEGVDVMSETEECEEEDDDEEEEEVGDLPPAASHRSSAASHAMIMRRASVNIYNGEGMEISDWDLQEDWEEQRRESLENLRQSSHHISGDEWLSEEEPTNEIVKSASFDELQSEDRLADFPPPERGPDLQRSYSEDELSAVLTLHMHHRFKEKRCSNATAATEQSDEDGESYDDFEYDAWDKEINKGLNALPFRILGTSADDVDSHPHVLSPPLMESLQVFMPFAKTSDNFWMKYSLVRDGASMHTLLQHARGAKYSILAIETVDGEVMGSFTNEPWRKTWSYFGGGECFLWKLRNSRKAKFNSIIDIAQLESEIEVYPYTGENQCIQFCTSRKIAVGGGSPDEAGKASMASLPEEGAEEVKDHDWGYGLALQGDLLHGSSSPCVTFGSPSLSTVHSDGSLFEIINIELWTMTPCFSEADAEKLELGKLFLEQQSSLSMQSNEDLNSLYG